MGRRPRTEIPSEKAPMDRGSNFDWLQPFKKEDHETVVQRSFVSSTGSRLS
jgi:hypothetical protein